MGRHFPADKPLSNLIRIYFDSISILFRFFFDSFSILFLFFFDAVIRHKTCLTAEL